MSTLKLLLAEIRYRKVGFALGLVAVGVAVTLLVAGPMLVEGYGRQTAAELAQLEDGVRQAAERVTQSELQQKADLARLEDETRVAMLGMGFNLVILHGATDMGEFWAAGGFPTHDMPEQYVERLAKDPRLTMVNHVVGMLRQKIEWQGRTVALAGYRPEATLSHRRKQAPLGYVVAPGTVLLGHQLAQAAGKKAGDDVEVLGKQFRVARLLDEQGSDEDNTIVVHLSDAQELLKKPGQVNQIMAIDCRCAEADTPKIRKQVADVVPECFVSRENAKAIPRLRQRALVGEQYQQTIARQKQDLESRREHLAQTAAGRAKMQDTLGALTGTVTLLVAVATAVWVGLLAMANVRERLTEIGLLRALGKGSGTIAALFLGKAVLLGLAGGAAGMVLGAALGFYLQVHALGLSSQEIRLPASALLTALLAAPLLSAVASYLPTVSAMMQDPAVVLRE